MVYNFFEIFLRAQRSPEFSHSQDPKRTSCRPVVLMHNHPGGDPTPSRADIEMTRVIVEIAKQFGIAIQGHIIVGKQGHASLKGLKLI
jgi:DNA repair protein RadC